MSTIRTVGELMEALGDCDEELPVYIFNDGDIVDITMVDNTISDRVDLNTQSGGHHKAMVFAHTKHKENDMKGKFISETGLNGFDAVAKVRANPDYEFSSNGGKWQTYKEFQENLNQSKHRGTWYKNTIRGLGEKTHMVRPKDEELSHFISQIDEVDIPITSRSEIVNLAEGALKDARDKLGLAMSLKVAENVKHIKLDLYAGDFNETDHWNQILEVLSSAGLHGKVKGDHIVVSVISAKEVK